MCISSSSDKRIEVPHVPSRHMMNSNHSSEADMCWIRASNGAYPPNAVIAGSENGENLYIARAAHEWSLNPGKLVPSQGVCCISWAGAEHRKSEYEVLCGGNGFFVPSGGNIPSNAIPAGKSESYEVLYIGRASYKGGQILGKVQRKHKICYNCYIPYDGREIPFAEYEIFVTNDQRSNVSYQFDEKLLADNILWVPASNGAYPSNAVAVGSDNGKDLYTARAIHQWALIPGKLVPSEGVCYVSCGGTVHQKSQYEVMCGGNGIFVPVVGGNVPPNAIPAGKSEDLETLYIGRALHKGMQIPGKVLKSRKVCYISYGEEEIPLAEFEIYVTNEQPLDSEFSSGICWIRASFGKYPSHAIVAGSSNGEDMYIARANHRGALTPGKLVPSDGVCIISWGGAEHRKREYEVLCGKSGVFVKTCGTKLPANAIKAGVSENDEPLYIGRVLHKGSQILGKVQVSFGVCFISYGGKEIPFAEYEIYVTNDQLSADSDGLLVKSLPAGNYAIPASVDVSLNTKISDVCWVPASNGSYPSTAVVAGVDGEDLYIARAYHQGVLIPGKLVPSDGACYVAWGGEAHRKHEYEVLCDDSGMFVPASEHYIPANAIQAGVSETNEPLYIGRVWHNDTQTLGKVQKSHGLCFIPYGGNEIPFSEYEIYVSNNQQSYIHSYDQHDENLLADSAFWSALRGQTLDQMRDHLSSDISISKECSTDDLSSALHQAVDSECEQTLVQNRRDIAIKLINAEFEGFEDAESLYQVMKRNAMDVLDLLVQNRNFASNNPKECLAKAWRRLEIDNVQLLPQMANFLHLISLRFEYEALNGKAEKLKTGVVHEEDTMPALMDGIDQLVSKQEQGGNIYHDVDVEFLEMLRAILKLLDAVRKLEYFPVYKLKFCIAIYLAIHDKKPSFNLYPLIINKVIIVDFLKLLKKAHLDPTQIVDKRMTKELLLALNEILMKNYNLKCKRILNLWASYLKQENMSELYTTTEQIFIQSFLRKTQVKETLNNIDCINFEINEVQSAKKVANHINDMFTSQRFDRKFKSLSKTFFLIKDLYSLIKVKDQLRILKTIHSSRTSPYVQVLATQRVMQVVGETLKSTSQTQNISSDLRSYLLDIAPDMVLDSIIGMRDFLSHDFTDQKYSFYKEANENKINSLVFLQCRDDLLKQKETLDKAYIRTIGKCIKSFFGRILQSDSIEEIHSYCQVIDLNPVLETHLNYKMWSIEKGFIGSDRFSKEKTVGETLMSYITLLPMINDFDDIRRISRLYQRLLLSQFSLAFKPTIVAVGNPNHENKLNKLKANNFNFYVKHTMAHKKGQLEDGVSARFTSNYFKNEMEQQFLELNLFDSDSLCEIFKQIRPYYKNILNTDEKYRTIKAVCKSLKLKLGVEKIKEMRKKDKQSVTSVFEQLLEDMANILPVGDEMTELEVASMITTHANCDIDLAAIEMIMLDALEILINRKVFPQCSSFLASARPIISGRFLRNYLAHDSLIYDAICRNSMNRRVTVLLNGICLIRYLKADIFKRPKPSKDLQTDEIEMISFNNLVGEHMKRHRDPSGVDQLEDIYCLIDYLVELQPNALQVYCKENNVDEEKWQELILHTILFKNETSARKLIDHFQLFNKNLPIASFLIPAVTKRMTNLVLHICELSPANIDYVNSDQHTALYRAVEVGCAESVKILLRFNAAVHRKPHSPLLRALELRRDDILDTLLPSGEALNNDKKLLMEVIYNAATVNRTDLLEHLRCFDREYVRNALIIAVVNDNIESVKTLHDIDATVSKFARCELFMWSSVKMIQWFSSLDPNYVYWSAVQLVMILWCNNRPHLRSLIQREKKINIYALQKLFNCGFMKDKPKMAREILQYGYPYRNMAGKSEWDGVKGWLPGMCRRKPEIIDCLDAYVLSLAILDGMSSFVRQILKKLLPKINEYDHGRLLNCAIRKQDLEMVNYLIKHGCNVNHADASQLTPLGMALSMIDVVSREKVDNKMNQEEKKNKIPSKILEELLSKGADVNQKTSLFFRNSNPWVSKDHILQDSTKVLEYPITIAVCSNNLTLVELLLSNGASINVNDDDGKSLLIKCMEKGFIQMTKRLMNLGADLDHARKFRYPNHGSILHHVVQHSYFEMYKHLVDNYNFDETLTDLKGNTILHIAIIYQNVEIVKYLWENNDVWVARNAEGHTSMQLTLHRYDRNSLGNNRLLNVIKARPEFVNEMESFSFSKGKTILHIAVSYSNESADFINLLIHELKLNVNCMDGDGFTPLHYVLRQGNLRLTNILVQAGATLFPKGVAKQKVFSGLASLLASRTDIVSLLLQDQRTADALKECSFEGKNLLQLAIVQNNYSLCKLLLDPYRFDTNVLDNKGNSTLHLAASIDSVRLSSLLLGNCLNIKARNNSLLHVNQPNNSGSTSVLDTLQKDKNLVAKCLFMKLIKNVRTYQLDECEVNSNGSEFEEYINPLSTWYDPDLFQMVYDFDFDDE